ncbi:hypothetical protein Tco_1466737 [Tanacetum coccineum]
MRNRIYSLWLLPHPQKETPVVIAPLRYRIPVQDRSSRRANGTDTRTMAQLLQAPRVNYRPMVLSNLVPEQNSSSVMTKKTRMLISVFLQQGSPPQCGSPIALLLGQEETKSSAPAPAHAPVKEVETKLCYLSMCHNAAAANVQPKSSGHSLVNTVTYPREELKGMDDCLAFNKISNLRIVNFLPLGIGKTSRNTLKKFWVFTEFISEWKFHSVIMINVAATSSPTLLHLGILEYAFLEVNNCCPSLLLIELDVVEISALVKVLKVPSELLAWKLSDIQGINPEFCNHKILMGRGLCTSGPTFNEGRGVPGLARDYIVYQRRRNDLCSERRK